MGKAISEVLPFAIGVAISPVPIIAVILVLFSTRARVNGPVFALGWIVGVAVISTVERIHTEHQERPGVADQRHDPVDGILLDEDRK